MLPGPNALIASIATKYIDPTVASGILYVVVGAGIVILVLGSMTL